MHHRTIATIEQLEKANWFSHVGMRDTANVIVLSSWQAAIEHCSSVEWENLCLEAANRYRTKLLEHSRARYGEWNQTVDAVKSSTETLVRKKLEDVNTQHHLPLIFEQTVQWDILHVCMEAEFADIVQPGFYASQAFWYIKGHFPCGWEGEFPKGSLIIY